MVNTAPDTEGTVRQRCISPRAKHGVVGRKEFEVEKIQRRDLTGGLHSK
jgi:hypothetical protein